MKPFASLETVVAQLTTGPTSGLPWDTDQLTFSFPMALSADHAGRSDGHTFSPFNDDQKAAARAAIQAFGDIAAVTFAEVGGNDGDLRFHNLGALPAANGFAGHPGPDAGGDVFVSPTNSEHHDLLNPHIGTGHGFITYLHEIGHAARATLLMRCLPRTPSSTR
jgi:hypothetical protein